VEKARLNDEWKAEYISMTLFEMDAIREGKEIGKEIGVEELLTEQIFKKIAKGKSLNQIADEIERTPDSIEKIYNTIIANPGIPIDDIFELLNIQRDI